MISSQLEQLLKTIKDSGKIPGVLLVTGLSQQESGQEGNQENSRENKIKSLTAVASNLEGEMVSEAKGNVILLESENQTSIKVDDVRDLLKKISLRNWDSTTGRYILVPRAELLTVQSSNALLKSLEESPEGTYFVLAAPSKRSLLKTILSRSFVLNEEMRESEASVDGGGVFYRAFFEQNFEGLLKLTKADLKFEWQNFSLKVREVFVSKVYSGELDKREWCRLFDFMDTLEQKIESNMDVKWLASAIERFDFNG